MVCTSVERPVLLLLLLLLLLSSSSSSSPLFSPLCRVFTITYLTQTMFLEFVVLSRFCIYNLCYIKRHFPCKMFCTFTLILSEVCVHCLVWMFFCSSFILCFPSMLLSYFLNYFEVVPVASIVTGINLFVHFTCAVFLL